MAGQVAVAAVHDAGERHDDMLELPERDRNAAGSTIDLKYLRLPGRDVNDSDKVFGRMNPRKKSIDRSVRHPTSAPLPSMPLVHHSRLTSSRPSMFLSHFFWLSIL